jgi:hypothetical protein
MSSSEDSADDLSARAHMVRAYANFFTALLAKAAICLLSLPQIKEQSSNKLTERRDVCVIKAGE